MKRIFFLSLLALALVFSSGCNKRVSGSGEVELENMIDSVSYALGFLEAQQFKTVVSQTAFDSIDVEKAASLFSDLGLQEGYLEFRTNQFGELNEDVFRTAFINELAYEYSYFDQTSADAYLQAMFSLFQEQKESDEQEASVKRSSEANDFLVENAQRDEVVVTESGLQYEILTQGDGAIPTATDQIECHYHGTLIDGTVFDSSVERGESITFAVGQVIPGWTEALQMMPVGSKWKLYIPSHLAYGEGGAGDAIGPNETLIFEVELLDIVD